MVSLETPSNRASPAGVAGRPWLMERVELPSVSPCQTVSLLLASGYAEIGGAGVDKLPTGRSSHCLRAESLLGGHCSSHHVLHCLVLRQVLVQYCMLANRGGRYDNYGPGPTLGLHSKMKA